MNPMPKDERFPHAPHVPAPKRAVKVAIGRCHYTLEAGPEAFTVGQPVRLGRDGKVHPSPMGQPFLGLVSESVPATAPSDEPPANVSEWGFSAFVEDIDVPRVLREARSDGRLLVEIRRGRADRVTVTEWWVHRDLIKMHDAMPEKSRPIVQFMIQSGAEWGTTTRLGEWLEVLRRGPRKTPVRVRAWK